MDLVRPGLEPGLANATRKISNLNAIPGFAPTQGEQWEEDDLPTMFPHLAAKYS